MKVPETTPARRPAGKRTVGELSTENVTALLATAKKANRRIPALVKQLAEVQRDLTAAKRRAAKREGELLRTIRDAKRDPGQAGSHPAIPKEERPHELAILVLEDEERVSIEAEIARLTVEREVVAGKLEAGRNEIKLIMLEVRDDMRGAGEPSYQPDQG